MNFKWFPDLTVGVLELASEDGIHTGLQWGGDSIIYFGDYSIGYVTVDVTSQCGCQSLLGATQG